MKNSSLIVLLTLLLTACTTEIENHLKSIINPPFIGIDMPFNTYQINPTKDNTIETDRGTIIQIPANIIVDENGKIIKEKVTLAYRPFHSAGEIIASGIPMSYDSLGQSFDFVSAGMFELNATVNKKEVFIAENKEISIDFASYNTEENFNIYKLNDENGEWAYIEPNLSTPNKKKEKELQKFKDDFIMELDIDYSAHPELSVFDKLSWVFNGQNQENNPINNPWIFEEKWRNVEIALFNEEKAIYTLHLTSKEKDLSILVSPYIEGDEELFLAEINNGILKYNETVKKRKNEELNIQIQADIVRSFGVSNFGVYNVDKINQILEDEELFVTNAGVIIQEKIQNKVGKMVMFYSENKTVLIRETEIWKNLIYNPSEDNTLMVIMPDNIVALCRKPQFDLINGKPRFNFNLTEYHKINTLEDIDNLLEGV